MKLSKNGATRFESLYFCEKQDLRDIEFNQNDFQGVAMLTVDEIFTLKQMVKWVLKSSRLNNTNKAFLETTYNFLNKCFEKAGGKDEVK